VKPNRISRAREREAVPTEKDADHVSKKRRKIMKKTIGALAIVFLSSMAAQAQQGSGGNSMGPGMMDGRGNGKGSGMMGSGNYSQSPECQEFYNQTAELRKELNEKRFEYFETQRNPEATEEATKLDKEIKELQEKISAKASPGCRW
jgi:hypothetical protein